MAFDTADQTSRLDDVAAEVFAQERVIQRALPVMMARVINDPELREMALREAMEMACRRMLEAAGTRAYQQTKRQSGGGPIGAQRSADLTGWAGAVASSLMDDFKLPNGKRLGDASRMDLETAMSAYQIQADDALVKYRWLRLVMQSLPSGKRVRDALTEERLAELRAEARKGEAQ